MIRPQLCPNCHSWFTTRAGTNACPFCGHEVAAGEIEAEAAQLASKRKSAPEQAEPFPWLELSPTFAFFVAIALMGAGIALRSFGLLAAGFGAIPCLLLGAAVLENMADRKYTADMPEDERHERESLKVAESVGRGFLPGIPLTAHRSDPQDAPAGGIATSRRPATVRRRSGISGLLAKIGATFGQSPD